MAATWCLSNVDGWMALRRQRKLLGTKKETSQRARMESLEVIMPYSGAVVLTSSFLRYLSYNKEYLRSFDYLRYLRYLYIRTS